MVSRVRLSLGGLLLAAAAVAGVAASAATVSLEVERFGRRQLAAAQDARDAFLATPGIGDVRTEGFEGFRAWNGHRGKTDPQRTGVAPNARIAASDFSERDIALTSCPSATKRLAAAPPTKPEAPVTKMRITPP